MYRDRAPVAAPPPPPVASARMFPLALEVEGVKKQSLTQLGLTFVALIVFGCAFGIPLALVGQWPLQVVFIVLLAVSLGVVAIANIVAHVVACVRAQSGKLWVIPWLRPIVKKWVPSDLRP